VALDRLERVAASVDTTRHFVSPASVPGSEHLVGRLNVPVPPGTYTYRLAVQEGEDAGVVLPRDSLRVGRPTSATLALSDLVLGNRSTNLYWRRTAEDTVVFNPLRTFRRNEDMELYYEVEGVAAGSKYDVRIAVRKQGKSGGLLKKVFGGGSAQLSLKFDETAGFPITATHRSLQLNKLKPGYYSLEVEVQDAQGRRDRRAQAFQVVDDKKTAETASNDEAALN
jgi:hypothetical protein